MIEDMKGKGKLKGRTPLRGAQRLTKPRQVGMPPLGCKSHDKAWGRRHSQGELSQKGGKI